MVQKDTSFHLPFTPLTAITPLDGRYRTKLNQLGLYVSEYAIIKTRIEIEVLYLIALSKKRIIRPLSAKELKTLHTFYQTFSLDQAEEVKKIEQKTRHDVKAMERIFRTFVLGTSLEDIVEYIHFGLTSEDINNLTYRLLFLRSTTDILIPSLEQILNVLCENALQYKKTPMLARTHGQPAVPTTLGKEFAVFAFRLYTQLQQLKDTQLTGKLSGAVGNFNALHFVYPTINWVAFSTEFVTQLGLIPNLMTTQINPYEDIITYLHIYQRINGILIDFDQDMWRYISDEWFHQEVRKDEVGSSTMPQKVNPIDFENSEGNLQLADSLIEGMARKLSISRLQRDLSDSTTIRNIGTILGYCLLGYKSILSGLDRVQPNIAKITEELYNDWAILTEGVQTYLRKEKVPDPYSLVASLSKGKKITEPIWSKWIDTLPITQKQKKHIRQLNPENYIGITDILVKQAVRSIQLKK